MIRLSVRLDHDENGVVLAELLELSPAGVEERTGDDGGVEYVIYGPSGELPALPELRAAAGDRLLRISSDEVADDWNERWKAWHRPVEVEGPHGRLRVRPPWEPPAPGEAIDLVVDPGQAFGTGAHDTTRLCLELLLSLEPGRGFADWGTGTGVLAIAAARLGYAPVLAVDHDALAVEAATANARVNGVGIEARRVDLRRETPPAAATVCANLLRPLLIEVARGMREVPERLIAAGLLREEADGIAAAFAARGLAEADRRSSGDWSALLMLRG